ncbi:MAG: ATP-dependent sacrificial sulfur transferase LarE [Opitutales bacterium]
MKKENLESILKGYGKVAIALSGGLDSSVLLGFAVKILGAGNVLALVAKSPYMMTQELDYGTALCAKYGVKRIVLERGLPKEIENNPANRCYICKLGLFSALLELARENGFETLCDGTNYDDLSDYRLGMKALAELKIASPLLDAKFTKADIRALAIGLGLVELSQKPAYACLMTRFEVGTKISIAELSLVDAGENFLRELGFNIFRLRKHGSCARIELAQADFNKIFEANIKEKINTKLKELGFKFVSIDLSPYKMGNMNG